MKYSRWRAGAAAVGEGEGEWDAAAPTEPDLTSAIQSSRSAKVIPCTRKWRYEHDVCDIAEIASQRDCRVSIRMQRVCSGVFDVRRGDARSALCLIRY